MVPPIGIEPMTTHYVRVPVVLADDDLSRFPPAATRPSTVKGWLRMATRGHVGDTGPSGTARGGNPSMPTLRPGVTSMRIRPNGRP